MRLLCHKGQCLIQMLWTCLTVMGLTQIKGLIDQVIVTTGVLMSQCYIGWNKSLIHAHHMSTIVSNHAAELEIMYGER